MAYRPAKWESDFLESYARTANVTHAASESGIHRQTVYDRIKAHPEFGDRMDAVRKAAIGRLEKTAFEKAEEGDESMMRWMLPRLDPAKWADPAKRLELSGPDGGAIRTAQDPPDFSKLTTEELLALRPVLAKMMAEEEGEDDGGE